MYCDRECELDCSALQFGCSERITLAGLQCFYLDFSISPPSKLGMHKMELGDSVYAAERIMKKRIRKVSFIFIILLTWTVLKLAKAVVITNLPLY